jgi:hypothetical protein
MLSFLTLLLARTPAMAGSCTDNVVVSDIIAGEDASNGREWSDDVSEIIVGEAASKCLEEVEWLKL